MNKIKNLVIYTGVVGGGSVALTYLAPAFWQPFAIISIMLMSIIFAVQDYISDGESSISFQTTPTRRPEGGDYEAERDELSGLYFAAGVFIFGIPVLFLVL